MTTHKYFKTHVRVTDPDVIIRHETSGSRVSYIESTARGKFYRVMPSNQREVLFVADLEHRRDKFAPKISLESDRGEGVLISEAAMAMIDA